MNARPEFDLIEHALERLHDSAGIVGRITEGSINEDTVVMLQFPNRTVSYHVVVKQKIDRIAVLAELKFHTLNARLLVTNRLSGEMATKCRELGIQFIDAAGNAYLNDNENVFVFVSGRKEKVGIVVPADHRASTPAALRVTFALFAKPQLLNAPLREIAMAANVSLGLTAKAFNALRARGYIGLDGSGKRAFVDRRQLVIEWTSGYINRLKPKLHTTRFTVTDPKTLMDLMKWQPQPGVSAWGGEIAAARLTNRLKPSIFTIYKAPESKFLTGWLVKNFKLQANPAGQIEIIDAFWGETLGIQELVPPELVYADLMTTLDNRNIETAKLILDTVITDA